MSLKLLMPDINEATQLLIYSHASRGGSVCLYRNGKVWNNPSALSILNAWNPKHRVVQKAFMDICGTGGDGGKLGVFISASLLKSAYKNNNPLSPQIAAQFLENFKHELDSAKQKATKEVLLEIGSRTTLAEDHLLSLCDALMSIGVDSHISLERGSSSHTEVIQSEALKIPVVSRINTDQVSLKGAMFACFDYPLTTYDQIQDALEQMGGFEGRPLCVVAPLLSREVQSTIAINRNKQVVEVYGLEAPTITWSKGWLEDLAAFTGSTIHTKLDKKFPIEFYGSALEVVIQDQSILIDPYEDHAEKTAERASLLLREVQLISHPHTQDLWRKRAASLMGSLVRVKIGGTTEAESKINLSLAEKALLSMSDALRNGYIKGVIPFLATMSSGVDDIDHALRCPLRIIAHNTHTSLQEAQTLNPIVHECFPLGRLSNLIERSLSISTTLGNIGCIIPSRRS